MTELDTIKFSLPNPELFQLDIPDLYEVSKIISVSETKVIAYATGDPKDIEEFFKEGLYDTITLKQIFVNKVTPELLSKRKELFQNFIEAKRKYLLAKAEFENYK